MCIEGIVIFGIMPYIAVLLERRDAGGMLEAGLIVAGFGVGGLIYTLTVARVLPRLGSMFNLIRLGGIVLGLGYVGIAAQGSWLLDLAAFLFVGYGFYAVHNSMQTEATEFAPGHRGAAVSLHAFFFFVGQAIGPALYAVILAQFGIAPIALAIAVTFPILAFCLAGVLSRLRNGGD